MISAGALAVIALSLDRNAAGVLAAITAGGALGFLRHGFPPASSFMGDTGSNLLGYLLGRRRGPGRAEDERRRRAGPAAARPRRADPRHGFVVAKRLKYRRPIYQADRWHFHHRMANIGFSQRRTLAYLYGWALVLAGLALALRFVPYSDDRGNFDPFWTAVMVALPADRAGGERLRRLRARDPQAARLRLRQRMGLGGAVPPPAGDLEAEVDEGVAARARDGEFAAVPDREPRPPETAEPRRRRRTSPRDPEHRRHLAGALEGHRAASQD